MTIDAAANDTDVDGDLDPGSANTACATGSDPMNRMPVNDGDGTFGCTLDPDYSREDSSVLEICDPGSP